MNPAICARLRLTPFAGFREDWKWGILVVVGAVPAKSGQVMLSLVERGLDH
jgi:hypothetical protein